jgi:hypothetical protein
MSAELGVWIAALCTIFMYSYLWRDNPLFKLGEHVFIAIGAAHAIVMGYQNIVEMAWKPMVGGKAYMALPLIFGFMLYTRFVKQFAMLSRIPIAFLVGLAAALSIRGALDASFIRQIASTMVPIRHVNDLITMLGVVTTISYFFFTAGARSGPLRISADIGRWVMMVAFGAAFGNTVMARMSLVIGRLQFLFGQWIKII